MPVALEIDYINKPIEDEFLAILILNGLLDTYDPMIMALENCRFN